MKKMWCTAQCYILTAFLLLPFQADCPGFACTIHSPKGPLAQGANHILIGLLRRVEGTLTGLFHGCSHSNMPPPPIFLQSQIPGGHHPACPCAPPCARGSAGLTAEAESPKLQKTSGLLGITTEAGNWVFHSSYLNLLIVPYYTKPQNRNLIAQILSFQFYFLSTGWRLHAVILRPT